MKIGILGTIGYPDFYRLTGGLLVRDLEFAMEQDILIFTGGEDVHPSIYNEEDYYCYETNLERDLFEREVLLEAVKRGIKVLGICRGHQFINAVLNGKLSQDIYKDFGWVHNVPGNHDFRPRPILHWKDPLLAELFPVVNTYHHQAVWIPGWDQEVILKSRDGVIEATSNKDGSIVTFQFHAEWDGIGHKYFKRLEETGLLI